MKKVYVNGSHGKMGKSLVRLIKADDYFQLSPIDESDVVIDFSTEEGLLQILPICISRNIPLVTGTTGLSDSTQDKILEAQSKIEIVQKSNFSDGIGLIIDMIVCIPHINSVQRVIIEESHNKSKKDSPSGTAKMLSKIFNERYGIKTEIISHRVDENITGVHKIKFFLQSEIVEITHLSESREVYAIGALNVAKTLV